MTWPGTLVTFYKLTGGLEGTRVDGRCDAKMECRDGPASPSFNQRERGDQAVLINQVHPWKNPRSIRFIPIPRHDLDVRFITSLILKLCGGTLLMTETL